MRRKNASLLFSMAGIFAAGCFNAPPFICTNDAQCNTKPPGVCVQFDNRPAYCAIAAGDCPSGFRYHNSAAVDLIGTCAIIPQIEITASATTVEEHAMLNIHVVVKDNSGQKLSTYHGKPQVLTNWGDAHVFSAGEFIGGEADFVVSLNRETNSTDGPAVVILQDGSVRGRSTGITVKAPKWYSFSETFGYDKTKVKPGQFGKLVFDGGNYYFAFAGTDLSTDPPQKALFLFTGPSVTNADMAAPFKFTAALTPFSSIDYDSPGLQFVVDGGTLTLGFDVKKGTDSFFALVRSTNGRTWTPINQKAIAVATTLPSGACGKFGGGLLVRDGPGLVRAFYGNHCTATSRDGGATWGDAQNFTQSSDDFFFLTLVKENSVYKVWNEVGQYATSQDAVHWAVGSQTGPTFITGVAWDSSTFYGMQASNDTWNILRRP